MAQGKATTFKEQKRSNQSLTWASWFSVLQRSHTSPVGPVRALVVQGLDGEVPPHAGRPSEVPGHEGHHGGDSGGSSSIPDHDRASVGGSAEGLRGPPSALGEWCHENPRCQTSPPKGQAPTLGETGGGGLQGYEPLGVSTQVGRLLLHLKKCNNGTVPFSACLQLAARQLGSEIRITPHNACYFNASIQAFFWFGALAGNDGHLYGAAKAGVSILRHKRRIYFPDSIAWRFVFARWDNLCRRQDASEFLRRLVSRTSPAAYSGHGRRDCATLSMPLIQVCLAPHCCYILEETAVRL